MIPECSRKDHDKKHSPKGPKERRMMLEKQREFTPAIKGLFSRLEGSPAGIWLQSGKIRQQAIDERNRRIKQLQTGNL